MNFEMEISMSFLKDFKDFVMEINGKELIKSKNHIV